MASRPRDNPAYVLAPGRERSLLQRHPWVFSGAIAKVRGHIEAGDTVDIVAFDGRVLARAAASPASQIRARVWTFDADARIDDAFLSTRIAAAVARRAGLLDASHDSARLVHAESDALPGLIVDRYGPMLVVQLLSAGAERWRVKIVEALAAMQGIEAIVERSDAEVRALEGLPPRRGVLWGTPPSALEIVEHGIRYGIDAEGGQKTGFFLDQRDNRRLFGTLAADADVLDVFCYAGGFGLNALRGKARSVLLLDSSADAVAACARNVWRNGVDAARATIVEADAFAHLRLLRDQGRGFDLITLDPPKLAPTSRHVERAARAYKDINLLALKLLRPGGALMTFSCSGGVGIELFQKIVAGAAIDARIDVQIVGRLTAAADHPVSLLFPEGEYLKGLLLRRTG
jgi:23S rRNA (cytosine1962-C5)-methyltransferase